MLPLDHGIGGGGAPPSALSVDCSFMLLSQGIGGGGAPPSALRYCESITPPPVDHGIGGGGAPPSARILSKFSLSHRPGAVANRSTAVTNKKKHNPFLKSIVVSPEMRFRSRLKGSAGKVTRRAGAPKQRVYIGRFSDHTSHLRTSTEREGTIEPLSRERRAASRSIGPREVLPSLVQSG